MAATGAILKATQEAAEAAVMGLTLNEEPSVPFDVRPVEERSGGDSIEELTGKERLFEWRLPLLHPMSWIIEGAGTARKRFISEIVITYPTTRLWNMAARDDVHLIQNYFLTSHNAIAAGVSGLELLIPAKELDATYDLYPEDPEWMVVRIPFLTIIEVS